MIRVLLVLLLSLCGTTAWGQYPIYPAYAQPPALSFYSQYQPQFYPGVPAYGYGRYGFGAGGYYLPNPPSPYYVTPSDKEYLDQARCRDRATCSELMLRHYLQK